MNDNEICRFCEYFNPNVTNFWEGWCTRFPKWEDVENWHYCGEFSEVKKDG